MAMTTPTDGRCSPLSGKKIIISGAGIAGLAFVASLRALWTDELGVFPHIVQYERDDGRPDLTREGYSVSIRSGGISLGMQALQKMALLDEILDTGVLRQSDEMPYLGLWSLKWSKLVIIRRVAAAGWPRSPMRIARVRLRQILLRAAQGAATIKWGMTCTQIIPATDGTVRVRLSNGQEDTGDLLIVADGANSKLRASVRPEDVLHFAGPVSISAISRFIKSPPKPVDQAWGLIPSGEGVSLFVSPMGDQTVNWSLSWMADSPRSELRQPLSPEMCHSLLEEAKSRGGAFGDLFHYLVDCSDTNTLMVLNAMDKQPFANHRANNVPSRVAFIGDSNHAVSAFAANGANLALADACDLTECLCRPTSIQEAIQEYDKRSLPRASATLTQSRQHIAFVHSRGWPWAFHQCWLLAYAVLMSLWYATKDILRVKTPLPHQRRS